MHRFPILLLHTFGSSPEQPLFDCRRLLGPNVLADINAVASIGIDHKPHFMPVIGNGLMPIDLRLNIECGDLCLAYRHMTHFWSIKVDAVAHRVYALLADD